MTIQITDNSVTGTPDYSLNPETLPFGKHFAANMFCCEHRDGAWRHATITPTAPLSLHPGSIVFHYAQAIFEGMKCYQSVKSDLLLFRPKLNAQRFNLSADRMAMPRLPEQLFVDAIKALVQANRAFVPHAPGTLYLRPSMIATEAHVGVRSASEYLFYILALPCGSYFSDGNQMIDVMIAEKASRAAPGGTGYAKAAANYAVSLKAITEAKSRGLSQVLFLDAIEHKYIEELGGMNVFFVCGDRLVTPEIHDTILNGVTRRSLLELAPTLGFTVEERRIAIDEVRTGIESGAITEVFACGTAAVVAPIRKLVYSDSGLALTLHSKEIGERLRNALTAIQFGEIEDNFGWTDAVD